jgi:hypothetical protein
LGNIIIPGKDGIGTAGFVPTSNGYESAADALVRLYDDNRYVNTNDYDVRRVMDYYGVSSLRELKIKRRGW